MSQTIKHPIGALLAVGLILASLFGPSTPRTARAAAGGPDAFGYFFIDSNESGGPSYSWIEIASSGVEVDTGISSSGNSCSGDDCEYGPFSLNFDFPFYGRGYSQVYISSNGYISFLSAGGDIPTSSLPNSDQPKASIFPFGGDQYALKDATHIYYQALSSPDRFIIEYVQLDKWSTTGNRSTFEIILYADGRILNQYQTLTGTADTIGIQDQTGTVGINYPTNNLENGLAVLYDLESGVYLLVDQAEKNSEPGQPVTFNLTLLNKTATGSIFDLSTAPGVWPVTLSANSTPSIPANGAATFTATVQVPANAAFGDTGAFHLTATARSNPNTAASIDLTVNLALSGYLFNPEDNRIYLVDTINHINTGSIMVPWDMNQEQSTWAWRGALSPDNQWLYVSERDSGAVLVVDRNTQQIVDEISVGAESQPHGIAFTADSAYALVALMGANQVAVIDVEDASVEKTLDVGYRPISVAVDSCMGKAYVTNADDASVSVIDTNTWTVSSTIALPAPSSPLVQPSQTAQSGQPWDVVFAPDGSRVYVSISSPPAIAVIDPATDAIVPDDPATSTVDEGYWPVEPGEIQVVLAGMDVAPDGSRVYTVDTISGGVFVFNTATGEQTGEISPDSEGYDGMGWEVEAFPDAYGPYLYATMPRYNRTTVFNTDTLIQTGWIEPPPSSEGYGVHGLALFPRAVCTREEPGVTDLGIVKTAATTQVLGGATLDYTLTVTNHGEIAATQVAIADTLPGGVSLVSADFAGAACTPNLSPAEPLTCSLAAPLQPAASAVAHVRVKVPASLNGAILTNSAQVSMYETDSNSQNNIASVSTPVVASQDVIDDDFDDDDPNLAWCQTHTTTAPNGEVFLGEFNNETVCIRLNGLQPHAGLRIEFDLYVLRSWDGNETHNELDAVQLLSIVGPDRWFFGMNGETPLLDTTFSNWDDRRQSYPASYLSADNVSMTGAAAVDTLGYTFGPFQQDSIYHMSYSVAHNGETAQIDFTASGLQVISDEGWGLDNVHISLIGERPNRYYLPVTLR